MDMLLNALVGTLTQYAFWEDTCYSHFNSSESTIKHVMLPTILTLKIYLQLFWSRLQNRTSH